MKLDKSVGYSIFSLFKNGLDKHGFATEPYQSTINLTLASNIFNKKFSKKLQQIIKGKVILCLDAQTRSQFAKNKIRALLKEIADDKKEQYILIGLTETRNLPTNVHDITREFTFSEFIGIPEYLPKAFIGIDNFWAHYFNLHLLKSKVIYRGGLSKKTNQRHEKYFLKAFKG